MLKCLKLTVFSRVYNDIDVRSYKCKIKLNIAPITFGNKYILILTGNIVINGIFTFAIY